MARLGAGESGFDNDEETTTNDRTGSIEDKESGITGGNSTDDADTTDRVDTSDPLSGGTETDTSTPDSTDDTDTSDRIDTSEPLSGGTDTDGSTPTSTTGGSDGGTQDKPIQQIEDATGDKANKPSQTTTIDPDTEGATPQDQGVEQFGTDKQVSYQGEEMSIREAAQKFERETTARYGLDPENTAVVPYETDQGTQFRLRYTEEGEAEALAEEVSSAYGDEAVVGVSDGQVEIDQSVIDAQIYSPRERRAVNAARAQTSGRTETTVADRLDPAVNKLNAASMQQGSRVGERPSRPGGFRPFEEFFKQEVAQTASEETGQNVKPGDVQLDYTDEGVEASIQERERFGDIDWSMGFGGEEDEVEQAVDRAAESVQKRGEDLADYLVGGETESAGEEILRAMGREDLGKAYEKNLETFGRGLVGGGTAIVNVPGLVGGVMEGVETGKYFTEETLAGRGEKAAEQGIRRGGAMWQQFKSNPYQSGGLLIGSLGLSSSIMSAAGKVSPRAGLASRAIIQPGEEALGYGGYGLTSRTAGTKWADRLFPQQEPLIFSEEAAIRATRAAAGKTKRAVRMAEAEYTKFAAADRGMARLTGPSLRSSKTELTAEDFDVDTELNDPTGAEAMEPESTESVLARERRETVREIESEEPEVVELEERGAMGDPIRRPSGRLAAEMESMRSEATEPEAKLDDSELAAEIEDTRVRFETALALDQRAALRAEQAAREQARLDERGLIDTREGADLIAEARNKLGLDTEGRGELALEAELGIEAEAEAEAELEAEAETEQRQEFELEQEQEFEQESEFEFEQEQEIEAEPDSPWERDWDAEELGFSTSKAEGGSGDRDLGAGYYNEFVTAFALGAGPREAPSEAKLAEMAGAVELTEQRPTQAMLSGTEAEQEQISEAEAFLAFGSSGTTDSGGDWWDLL